MDLKHTKYLLNDLATDLTLYSEIYGPEESVLVLNEFNGFVFGRFQFCLIERIMLGFARLMDPAESRVKGGKNENLSLKNLIKTYDLDSDNDVSRIFSEIETMYESANIRNYRNMLLSHNDKQVKLGDIKVNLTITPNEAHTMLSHMFSFISVIEYKTGKSSHRVSKSSHITLPRDKGGIAFINKLKKYV